MLVEKAQTFSPEQINTFVLLIGGLVMSNIGGLFSWGLRSLKRHWKKDQDLDAAFKRIRRIELVLNLQNELENSKEKK